jgi:Family of unknown function (DUF6183)
VEPRVAEQVETGDLNALLRAVDGLCASRSWEALIELAQLCERAIERGKQLWPITSHIDYRLALEAPGEYAAEVLRPEVGRFAHGPLTEVAASSHTWEELAPFIEIPQAAAYVAQERVIRGEVLTGDGRAHPEVLELPLRLEPWEPAYPVATFKATYVEIPEVWEPAAPVRMEDPRPAEPLDEPEIQHALLDLVQPWTSESNGAARAAVVEGDATAAASSLALGTVRMGVLEPAEALQWMAWAAASGGAYGRRRGVALGRFLTWYTSSLLADQPWPAAPDELGRALGELRWYRWDEGDPDQGWALRIAVEDPNHGWAAAIGATDLREDDASD